MFQHLLWLTRLEYHLLMSPKPWSGIHVALRESLLNETLKPSASATHIKRSVLHCTLSGHTSHSMTITPGPKLLTRPSPGASSNS